MTRQILLSYSRRHFDPDRDLGPSARPGEFHGSSAHLLATAWYDVLSELGEVTYIDPSEHATVSGRSFDLFVGQIEQFRKIAESCRVDRSILFAVNCHPATRNRALRSLRRREGIPRSALANWDLVDEREHRRAIDLADHVIGVGNGVVLNSFLDNGVPPSKIKMINYGVGPTVHRPGRGHKASRLLYCASDIGLRKGFDVVDSLVRSLADEGHDFHLDIVGSCTLPYYQRKLERLASDLPGRVTVHGWVPAHSEQYQDILSDAAFLLAPAVEEGQAGAVLDAMRTGVVPVVSSATGIDFSPLGTLDVALKSKGNLDVLRKAVSLSEPELERLRRKTLEYYEEFHPDPRALLRQVVERVCSTGHLHPPVSVTLPIFNKEKTIVRLLEHFHQAAEAYGNIELHVIFDGCSDRTEQLVRAFFATRDAYPVNFRTTPNIFEVKTSNIGLRASTGTYCVLLQDDNVIYDRHLFFEATTFLDKSRKSAVLGCLAGVNFYPLGTELSGSGQIAMTEHEVYWRQDADTDPELRSKVFEVDACMRGPLFLRRSFLQEHGYLDEIYAPLYMDDMDLCFRVRDRGSKVYCMLASVENESLTMAHYDSARWAFFESVLRANTKIFYERWSPSETKDYLSVERIPLSGGRVRKPIAVRVSRSRRFAGGVRKAGLALRVFDARYCRALAEGLGGRRRLWIEEQAASVPDDATVLEITAGGPELAPNFAHATHLTQELAEQAIPHPDESVDVVLCSDLLECTPDPVGQLSEFARVLRPGGRLILTARTGPEARSGQPQLYGGFTRSWYEAFLPANGLEIVALQPRGGRYAHAAGLLWKASDQIIAPLRQGSAPKKALASLLQIVAFNLPTLLLHRVERRHSEDEFAVGFHCVARKQAAGL